MQHSIRLASVFCLAACCSAHGAGLWDAEGADALWSTGDNWEFNFPPVNIADAVVTFFHPNEAGGGFFPEIDSSVTATPGTLLLGDLAEEFWGGGEVTLTMTGGSLQVDRPTSPVFGDFQLGRVGFGGYTTVGDNLARFDLSGGDVFVEGGLFVGNGSSAVVNQTGGTMSLNAFIMNQQDLGPSDSIHEYNLDGGSVELRFDEINGESTGEFSIYSKSVLDFGGGVMTLRNDFTTVVQDYITSGAITAYDGTGTVSVVYDPLENLTTVVGMVGGDLVGDYNDDGVVDAADYTVWRDNFGENTPLPNDPLGGQIGAQQYDQWVANYGELGSAVSSAAAIPEPCSIAVALLAVGFGNTGRCRARSRRA